MTEISLEVLKVLNSSPNGGAKFSVLSKSQIIELCPLRKGKDNSEIEPNEHNPINNFVKVKIVQEVFRHAESKSGILFWALFVR